MLIFRNGRSSEDDYSGRPINQLPSQPSLQRARHSEEVIALRRSLAGPDKHRGIVRIHILSGFPNGFLALIDTYDTCSGLHAFYNAYVLLWFSPVGIRLDSGDLAWLSLECRAAFEQFAKEHDVPSFAAMKIVASNDINESILVSLEDQGHSIDAFGIGTNLVTCQAQPALGMVYKLVEIDGKPRIKLSNDLSKITIPGRKKLYRLIGKKGVPLIDVMLKSDESPPEPGRKMLCCHPFDAGKRVYVTPAAMLPLVFCWRGGREKNESEETKLSPTPSLPSLEQLRDFSRDQLQMMRPDHLRAVNPTPYKVALSASLHSFFHDLWVKEQPIAELE